MKNSNPHQLAARISQAADAYRTTPDAIIGKRRDALATAARAEVIYWARKRAGYGLTFLSQFFDRNTSTILAAERRHEKAILLAKGA